MENQDELDELISQWTSEQEPGEVMAKLQDAGVAASIVSQGQDLHDSVHLRERGFYRNTNYYLG